MFIENNFAIELKENKQAFLRKADLIYNEKTLLTRFNIEIEQAIPAE
jgi:hypothetical protein